MIVSFCVECQKDLKEGWDVPFDPEADAHFCDDACAEKYMIQHLEGYLKHLNPNTKRLRRYKKYILRNWEKEEVYWRIAEYALLEVRLEEEINLWA